MFFGFRPVVAEPICPRRVVQRGTPIFTWRAARTHGSNARGGDDPGKKEQRGPCVCARPQLCVERATVTFLRPVP